MSIRTITLIALTALAFSYSSSGGQHRAAGKPGFEAAKNSGATPTLMWSTQLATHQSSSQDWALAATVDRFGNSYVTGKNPGLGTAEDMITAKFDSTGGLLWLSRHDGPAHGNDEANAIALDSLGNAYVSGFQVGLDGYLELTAIKYLEDGTEAWVHGFPSKSTHYYGTKIALDQSGDVCVAGPDWNYDLAQVVTTLVQYDPFGNKNWNIVLNSKLELVKLLFDNTNNVFLVSHIPTGQNSLVQKISPSGVWQWDRSVYEDIHDAISDGAGNLFVTGGARYLYTSKLDTLTQMVWEDHILDSSVTTGWKLVLDAHGGICVAGAAIDGSEGITVARYAPNGHLDWSYLHQEFGIVLGTRVHLAIDKTDNIFVGTTDTWHYYLLQVSSNGNYVSGSYRPGGYFLAGGFDLQGNYITAGSFYDETTQNVDLAISSFNSNGDFIRNTRYEDHANSYDMAADMVIDDSGNTYVGGHSHYKGLKTLTMWKLDRDGNELWHTFATDSSSANFECVAVRRKPSGNIIMMGLRRAQSDWGDYYFAEIDQNGAIVWKKQLTVTPQYNIDKPTSLAIDQQGNIYACAFQYPANFLTIKLDQNGELLWATTNHGPYDDNFYSPMIRIGKDHGIYVAGSRLGSDGHYGFLIVRYDTLGNETWNSHLLDTNGNDDLMNAMILDDSSNVICVGTGVRNYGTTSDFIMTKSEPSGILQWIAQYDTTTHDAFQNVAIDHASNIVGIGQVFRYPGLPDFGVLKYDLAGALLWKNTPLDFPSLYSDLMMHVAIDKQNNIYGVGETYATTYERDLSVVGYSGDGTTQWAGYFEGLYYGTDVAKGIAVDNDGNLIVLESCYLKNGGSSVINVFKLGTGTISSINDESQAARTSNILEFHSWPNPFNSSTRIAYNLPSNSAVTLRVFNVLGQEVSRPIDEYQSAGSHTFTWSPDHLPSGAYFCQLKADHQTKLLKLFLMK